MVATPLRTSDHSQAASDTVAASGGMVPAGANHSARGTPSAGYRATAWACSSTRSVQGSGIAGAATLNAERAASPASPRNSKAAVASLNLTLARKTNIDRRFKVGAKMSAETTSAKSSGARRTPTKLASSRPLGEQ